MTRILKLSKSFIILVTQQELEGVQLSVITRIRSGWTKFRDLVILLARRGLALAATGRLHCASVHSAMLYGSET